MAESNPNIVTELKSLVGGFVSVKDKFIDAVSHSLTELKQMDQLLVTISKDTDTITAKQLKALSDASFPAAGKYGSAASEYLNALQQMNQAGYKYSGEMAELNLLTQNVSDMTGKLAAQYLSASDTIFQYGGSVRELNALLDGQNQVTNRNSISFSELASSISAAGSALSGLPEEKATALLGTGISASGKSGEEVGRAVRGILLNLQKGQGASFGDIIDENQLKRVEKRCRSLGIELKTLRNGAVKLRDPIKILEELAKAYNSLPESSPKRQGILTDIGGGQAEILDSILSNWDKYEKMTGDFSNSAGSAMAESAKVSESWEGSLNRLSNTWTDTVENVINSDAVVSGINRLNDLLSVINNITGALGSWGSIGAGIGAFLGAKNLGRHKSVSHIHCLLF